MTMLKADKTELDVEGDPLGATEYLLGLVETPSFKARLCNLTPPLTPQQIDAEAARGVRTFLKAFARKGRGPPAPGPGEPKVLLAEAAVRPWRPGVSGLGA
jgi:hypothetical protein